MACDRYFGLGSAGAALIERGGSQKSAKKDE